jgi:hypothetical protein
MFAVRVGGGWQPFADFVHQFGSKEIETTKTHPDDGKTYQFQSNKLADDNIGVSSPSLSSPTPAASHQYQADLDDEIDVLVARELPAVASEVPPNFERIVYGRYKFGTKLINMDINNRGALAGMSNNRHNKNNNNNQQQHTNNILFFLLDSTRGRRMGRFCGVCPKVWQQGN